MAVAPDGTVYVADTFNDRVQAFCVSARAGVSGDQGDATPIRQAFAAAVPFAAMGQPDEACACAASPCFLRTWGRLGPEEGRFSVPRDVTVSPGGTISVIDAGNRRLQSFDATGTLLAVWFDLELGAATAVAAAPDDTLYVVEQTNRVRHVTAEGTVLDVWGSEGHGPGEFFMPHGIAVAPDGTVYVADTSNHRIQAFDGTGAFLSEWGREGPEPGAFSAPQAVAVAQDGTVYVADMGNHRIQFFTADGLYLGQWATEGSSLLAGPTSIAVAPDGKAVYVTRGHEDRVLIYGLGPTPGAWGSEGQGPGEFTNPDGVAVAPDGTVYVLDAGNHRVQAFSACVAG